MYVFGSRFQQHLAFFAQPGISLDDFNRLPLPLSDRDHAWLRALRGSFNPLWFYNFSLGEWVNGT